MAKILAVDDEPSCIAALERSLRSRGHRVVSALGGVEALQRLRTECFDIAVVDYGIPPPDGIELLQELRELQPRCLRVLISGRLDLQTVMDAVNRGEVNRVLSKPLGERALLAAVEDSLARYRRIEELQRQIVRGAAEQQQRWLEEALRGDTVQLALQPIVGALDGSVVAYEALLRSAHPVLATPTAMLQAAEGAGMLSAVTSVVVERARVWLDRLPAGVVLFMNLHPTELADPNRLQRTLQPLLSCASRMVIEITEGSSLLELETWRESIGLLGERGFSIAVDDLGAGYSSLAVLAALRPQYMKVDMSIVRDVHEDAHKRRLIELLTRFADASGARLIAEGVETAGEAAALRQIGVHLLQGYLFGRPSLQPF